MENQVQEKRSVTLTNPTSAAKILTTHRGGMVTVYGVRSADGPNTVTIDLSDASDAVVRRYEGMDKQGFGVDFHGPVQLGTQKGQARATAVSPEPYTGSEEEVVDRVEAARKKMAQLRVQKAREARSKTAPLPVQPLNPVEVKQQEVADAVQAAINESDEIATEEHVDAGEVMSAESLSVFRKADLVEIAASLNITEDIESKNKSELIDLILKAQPA